MKRHIFLSTIFLVLSFFNLDISAQSVYGGMKLLDGYSYQKQSVVDGESGTISKKNGLRIDFEAGFSQGYAVDESEKSKYAWLKKRIINGQEVLIAFIKKNTKTVWEPENPRNKETGNILLVTYPLSKQRDHAINFRAEILSNEELVDALLMILTFDKKK